MNLQQTRQLLQNSQSRFISLFEQSPQSMVLFSPSGYIRGANQAFEELFNLAADDLIAVNFNLIEHDTIMGSGIFEHIFIGFTRKFVELPQTVIFSGKTVRIVDNDDLWLRCCLYPVRDDQGEVIEVVMMHRDVSSQFPPSLLNFNRELENRVAERTRKL
ncbi:MAG: PAS domain-containing protein, partial [Desulfobacterales bacterium]|nr:PAS domain-containing protein [Desulfobacterales bacterium]